MPLSDVIAAALSRPAGRVVEGPVRTIVNEVLQDHGYASPAEVQALRDELAELQKTVRQLEARLQAVEGQTTRLEAAAARPAPAAAPQPAPAAAPTPAAAVEAAPAAPAPAASPASLTAEAAPLTGAEALTPEQRHKWRAGRLPGFVGPEGLVEIDGAPFRVDMAYAGHPYEITGKTRKRIRVSGEYVKKTAL